MTFIKVNGTLYPSEINGKIKDNEWDNRESKSITLEMDYIMASILFVDGLSWSIFEQEEVPVYNENGEQVGTEIRENEYDNSDFCLAGDITDHRDGTMTIKMGKLTELEEAYEIMLGGI